MAIGARCKPNTLLLLGVDKGSSFVWTIGGKYFGDGKLPVDAFGRN